MGYCVVVLCCVDPGTAPLSASPCLSALASCHPSCTGMSSSSHAPNQTYTQYMDTRLYLLLCLEGDGQYTCLVMAAMPLYGFTEVLHQELHTLDCLFEGILCICILEAQRHS